VYQPGQQIVVPLKNGEGGFVADDRTLDELEGEGRVVARYLGDNPNGSYRAIAGISNAAGNVVGLMPHPEHATEPGYGPDPRSGTNGLDGLGFFTSAVAALSEGLVRA
jgi:phosphoribosylformylglycinamidine synthase